MIIKSMPSSIVILLLVVLCSSQVCHYSCATCSDKTYTSCLTCPFNNAHTFRVTTDPVLQGPCASLTTGNVNIFGILFLIVAVCVAIVILDEQIIYILLFVQSLSLVYLVEVSLTPHVLDYLLQGITYMMVFSKATYSTKSSPTINPHPQLCKGRIYFVQYNIGPNIRGVGVANVLIISLLFIIVVFKSLRKKCVLQRVQCLPDWILDKTTRALSIAFIFIIQETVSVIFFSFKYGGAGVDSVVITIFYFLIVILFTVNQFLYPLGFFRGKGAQLNTILGKIFCPLFLAVPTHAHYVLFIFLLGFWVVDLGFTHKNRNNNTFNRLLLYKIIGLLLILLLLIYYAVEIIRNNENTSLYLGIICTVILCLYLQLPLMEICIKIRKDCCQEMKKGILKQNQSSNLTYSKKQSNHAQKQVTLQNIKMEEQLQQSKVVQIHNVNRKQKPPPKLNYNFEENDYVEKDVQSNKRKLKFDEQFDEGLDPSQLIFSQDPHFKEMQTLSIRPVAIKSKSSEPLAKKQISELEPESSEKSQLPESKEQKQVRQERQITEEKTIIAMVEQFQDIPQKKQTPKVTQEPPMEKQKKKKYHKSKKRHSNREFQD